MLTIEQRTIEPDIQVLQLGGRVTLGESAQELEVAVERLMAAQPKKVVFDLSGLKFVDSTGIRTIVMCASRLKGTGGTVHLAGAQGIVQEALHLLRIADMVPIFESVNEAVAAFFSK